MGTSNYRKQSCERVGCRRPPATIWPVFPELRYKESTAFAFFSFASVSYLVTYLVTSYLEMSFHPF